MAEGVNTATGIILVAGTITFANEWYQTGKADFKVAVATMIAAAVFDGISHISPTAGTGLAVIALLAAFTTKFNGKSVADTVAGIFSEATNKKQPQKGQHK